MDILQTPGIEAPMGTEERLIAEFQTALRMENEATLAQEATQHAQKKVSNFFERHREDGKLPLASWLHEDDLIDLGLLTYSVELHKEEERTKPQRDTAATYMRNILQQGNYVGRLVEVTAVSEGSRPIQVLARNKYYETVSRGSKSQVKGRIDTVPYSNEPQFLRITPLSRPRLRAIDAYVAQVIVPGDTEPLVHIEFLK